MRMELKYLNRAGIFNKLNGFSVYHLEWKCVGLLLSGNDFLSAFYLVYSCSELKNESKQTNERK